MVKKKKNDRKTNIENTIKSILLSDREIDSSNLKFSILKEILLSEKKEEIFKKRTFEFRKLIVFYKSAIDEDPLLNSATNYFKELEEIRIGRVNEIINNGKTNDIVVNKIKNINKDEDLEENWIDRGYTNIKLTNGMIEVKIEDLTQLSYQLKMLQLETINNITTTNVVIDLKEFENWINLLYEYSNKTYNSKPIFNKNIIDVGYDKYKFEKIFMYYCITDGKIHLIKRVKYF